MYPVQHWRIDDSRMHLRGLAVNLILVGIVLVAVAGVVRWLVHRALAPARVAEVETPRHRGLDYVAVAIATENAKRLHGWFIAGAGAGRRPAVVLLHGWGGNAEAMLPLARPLHDAGFSVLLIDARCHGRSDEDSFASMPRFAEDLGHAIDWLQRRDDVDSRAVAAIGHSVGAAAVLLAAAHRSDLAAVVSIAAFAHPAAMMRRWLAAKGIPRSVGALILRYVEWVIGHRFDAIAPVNTIRRVSCPTLLIHGDSDETVPLDEARAIHAGRCGDRVVLKIVVGGHDDYADLDRELPALVAFLSQSVRSGSPPAGQ